MVEEPLLTVTVPTIIIAIESSSPKKSYDKVISSLILCLRKPREVKQCAWGYIISKRSTKVYRF